MASSKSSASKPLTGVVTARSTKVFLGPPGTLGWNHLVTPDEYTDTHGKLVKTFKAAIHHTDAQLSALVQRIDQYVVEALWEDWLEEAIAKGCPTRVFKEKGVLKEASWERPSAQVWVDNGVVHLQEGQLPAIRFSNQAEYTDKKTGQVKTKTMRATDATGEAALDLRKIRLGMGSIVQPLLTPCLYASITSQMLPAISVKLQGIRVIKLVQWGSTAASVDEISQEDLDLVGDIEPDDLSAYLKGKTQEDSPPASGQPATDQDLQDELLDDDIPF